MTRYVVNNQYHNYETITLDNKEVLEDKGNIVVFIIDNECENETNNYYKMILNLIKGINRVILIGVEDGNKLFKTLATLMISLNSYDIYNVYTKDEINIKWLLEIEKRKPTYSEVQTFISGKMTAYSELSNIIFGIQSIVTESGDTDVLKEFIEEHIEDIENLSDTINVMKKEADVTESQELLSEVTTLKEKVTKLNKKAEETDNELSDIKFERDESKTKADKLLKENRALTNRLTEMEELSNQSNGAIIKSFNTLNVKHIANCRAKSIIYFKEISYVRYTNTLIKLFDTFIEKVCKLRAKTIIYDVDCEYPMKYSPLNVVNGSDYNIRKGELLKPSPNRAFVVTEPSQDILQDVLQNDANYDVVMIYDRTHTIGDIVKGDIVYNVYVVASKADYEGVCKQMRLDTNPETNIITYKDSRLTNDYKARFIDIPTIEKFSSSTDTSQIQSYMRQASYIRKEPLFYDLCKLSRIDAITEIDLDAKFSRK